MIPEAIYGAVHYPEILFVPVKSAKHQVVLSVHQMQLVWFREQTALILQVQGLLAKFGIEQPQGHWIVQRVLPLFIKDADNNLLPMVRAVLSTENIKKASLRHWLKVTFQMGTSTARAPSALLCWRSYLPGLLFGPERFNDLGIYPIDSYIFVSALCPAIKEEKLTIG